MLVYSSWRFVGKKNGHGYEYYTRDAICGECGYVIGRQECYDYNKDESKMKFSFREREKNSYEFCPYCGEKLKKIILKKDDCYEL